MEGPINPHKNQRNDSMAESAHDDSIPSRRTILVVRRETKNERKKIRNEKWTRKEGKWWRGGGGVVRSVGAALIKAGSDDDATHQI